MSALWKLLDQTVSGAITRARNLLAIVGLVNLVLAIKVGWIAVLVVAIVVIPALCVAGRDLRKARVALEIVGTWGEGIYGGVRWGWRPGEGAESVLGPYCPNLGHGQRLRLQDGSEVRDEDVIGEGALRCPQDPAERFDFRSLSPEPMRVEDVRRSVRERVRMLGVWKRS